MPVTCYWCRDTTLGVHQCSINTRRRHELSYYLRHSRESRRRAGTVANGINEQTDINDLLATLNTENDTIPGVVDSNLVPYPGSSIGAFDEDEQERGE